ncbi:MAG TPA: permease [Acidobacteriota bacterium]|nr:permease [Acidobacteriota bacterium]
MNNKKIGKSREKKGSPKNILRDYLIFLSVLGAGIILLFIFPDKKEAASSTAWSYFREMMAILPAVMVIIGLFSVFISQEQVVKYLGKASGVKGPLLAIFFGALPTGPLYIAFPLAAALIKKGARISNVVVFISAWACIKIPQELVELQFLGFKFMGIRLILTVFFVMLMGLLIEQLVTQKKTKMHL